MQSFHENYYNIIVFYFQKDEITIPFWFLHRHQMSYYYETMPSKIDGNYANHPYQLPFPGPKENAQQLA